MAGEPKTLAEHLDAARDGEEFGAVLMELFAALDRARDEADGGER